jgi:hypothetical protein
MWKTIGAVTALAVALVAYYIDNLVRKRRQLDGLVSMTLLNFILYKSTLDMELGGLFLGVETLQHCSFCVNLRLIIIQAPAAHA